MKQSKFNFAAVFSLMVLLAFAYIAFLGLVYWKEGEILLPALLTGAFIAVVIGCLVVMCMSKASRWKRISVIGQAVFGTIILVAFIAWSMPFTNFMDVLANQKRFNTETESMLESAAQLDDEYQQYVTDRVEKYRSYLTHVSNGRNEQPSVYNDVLGGAAGDNDATKINDITTSLLNKLMPESISEVQEERRYWVESASNMSVWNISLPKNIAKINAEVSNWQNIYAGYSNFKLKGETAEPFVSEDFESDLETLTAKYTKLHAPSVLAIGIALLCFLIMLLPYWLTERDVAGRTSKGTSVYE
jgi:hypothetical protein